MANFLAVEVETGRTFLRMASTANDLRKKNWHVQNAQKAYDTILRFIPRAMLSKEQTVRIEMEMSELRDGLEKLGQTAISPSDIESEPSAAAHRLGTMRKSPHGRRHRTILERVQLFEQDCRQMRAFASTMAQQNHDLMNTKRPRVNHR